MKAIGWSPTHVPGEHDSTCPTRGVPVTAGSSVNCGARVTNEAVTVTLVVSVRWHGSVPEHPPPLQPANVEPATGEAVNVSSVPSG